MSPEMIPWLAVLLLLVGLLALILEVFIAGFGFFGMAGIILFGWGILLLSFDVAVTLKSLVIAVAVSFAVFFAGVKILTRLNFWQRFTLGTRQEKNTGYTAPREELRAYAGREGITLTPLRPAGSVEIDGERLDVVTEGGFVPPGAKVTVVKVDSGRIIVRPL